MAPPSRAWVFRLLAAGALALAGTRSAAGLDQAVADPLAAFRDSLAAAATDDAVRALERALMARAKRGRDPGVHYRLGLIAVRLGEPSDAVSEFKTATQLAPQWGAAWLGLARAELSLGEIADTTRLGRRAFLAKDAWDRSIQAFGRATALDTAAAAEAVGLARERVAADRSASATVVRDGLRRAVTGRIRPAETDLALGRVEALLGDTAAAILAFEAAAGRPGGRGIGLLEAARLRLAGGDLRGVGQYFAAAESDEPALIRALVDDVVRIATAAEMAGFGARRGPERARFLRDFWARRDRADLRREGERLVEHYRRIGAARRLFVNQDDQRVAVWVRHGEPDNRATFRAPGIRPNESWRYRRAEGDLLVHFVASDDTTNLRVVESVFDLAGPPAGTALAGGALPGDEVAPELVDQILRSRAALSPFYLAAVDGRRDQLARFRVREREEGRAGKNLSLTTDRFPLRFERDLPARIQIASLGRLAADVLVVIPGFAFDSAAPETVRIRLVAWDSAGAPGQAIDTVVPVAPVAARIGATRYQARVTLPLPAGRYTSRASVEAGTRGTVVSREGLLVEAGVGVGLGDLLLGGRGAGAEWREGDGTVVADPGLVFLRTDTLVAAAAATGPWPEGTRVRAIVRTVRADGRETDWRSWPKSEAAAVVGGWARLLLPLRSLRPGRHEIELVVEGPGRTVRQRARFAVVDRVE